MPSHHQVTFSSKFRLVSLFQIDGTTVLSATVSQTTNLEATISHGATSTVMTDSLKDVGDGNIDFPAFTRAALAAGAEHFFVERDGPPQPMQSIRRSYAYLSQMTF